MHFDKVPACAPACVHQVTVTKALLNCWTKLSRTNLQFGPEQFGPAVYQSWGDLDLKYSCTCMHDSSLVRAPKADHSHEICRIKQNGYICEM